MLFHNSWRRPKRTGNKRFDADVDASAAGKPTMLVVCEVQCLAAKSVQVMPDCGLLGENGKDLPE